MTTSPRRAPKRLLVIDDDRFQRLVIGRIAAGMGYEVSEVQSVEDLPQALEASSPDVVILDLSLGNNDGVEALRAFTNLAVPPGVVIMSAQDERVRDVVRRYVRALGLRDMGELTKPVNVGRLRQKLSSPPQRHEEDTAAGPSMEFSSHDIVAALHDGEIQPAYQPKVELATGLIVGAEALARWMRPSHGSISPGIFCPMIDRAGLTAELTKTMLEASCRDVSAWRRFHPDMTVSVNVSPVAVTGPGFFDMVVEMLDRHGLDPGALTLELLETVSTFENHTELACTLTRLRIKGVGLAVDDFGTGFSSLASLHTLPFGEMKIDASFVRDCDQDRYAWSIVKASLAMGREFDMVTVAEGIESSAIRDRLQEAGCRIGQGYLYSPAIDRAAVRDLLVPRAQAQARRI